MQNDSENEMTMRDRKKSDSHFFIKSGIFVVLITLILLTCYTSYMTAQTNDTIKNVSGIYMSEINLQLQQKFKSIMELRYTQVDELMTALDYGDVTDETVRASIERMATTRKLNYAGFLDEDYKLVPIYGDNLTIEGDNDIEASIAHDGNVLEYATDENGEKYLMFGRGTNDYILGNGKRSTAFVACIKMSVMDDALFLDDDVGNVYTHVINYNGDFIVSNGMIEGDNYFDGILQLEFSDANGAENCINGLKHAIETDTQYAFSYKLNDGQYYVCCSSFADNSEWYYVTVMQSTVFDEYFDRLDHVRLMTMVAVIIILLASILGVIILYYRKNQKQIEELDNAKMLAIKESNAKSEFLSNMSHDLRTPMNAVIGMTNIAIKHIDDKERVSYCLEKVVTSSKHLLSMVNDILDISKIESGKMELLIRPSSIKSMIDDLVALSQSMLKEKGQEFDVFIHEIAAEDVYCDDIRVYQILVNIVSNAFKYTPAGGKIHVDVHQEPSDKGEDYIKTVFKVIDTGVGMAPEFVDKIFEKFEREDKEIVRSSIGTGLGMSISKQLADLMDGELTVESVLNEGSVFSLSVDFKIAQASEITEKLPAWDVLIVDDDELLCKTAASSLEELGVKAEWITESVKAVELIIQRHKAGKDFDFVFLDWNMPDMDGVETIEKIRSSGCVNLPVFLISAYDLGDVEDKIDLTEFEGFIAKPLFKSRLYQVLGKYAGRASVEKTEPKESVTKFTGKRVLVAEDVEINWEIVKEALTSVGLEAEIAENGKECVDMLCASPVGYYDLILMDIRMPVMDGIEATKIIRKLDRQDKDLPIVAMTANAFSGDVQQCLDCGMNAHISKPLDLKTFFTILHRFLDN